jgi:hypothetical protein
MILWIQVGEESSQIVFPVLVMTSFSSIFSWIFRASLHKLTASRYAHQLKHGDLLDSSRRRSSQISIILFFLVHWHVFSFVFSWIFCVLAQQSQGRSMFWIQVGEEVHNCFLLLFCFMTSFSRLHFLMNLLRPCTSSNRLICALIEAWRFLGFK